MNTLNRAALACLPPLLPLLLLAACGGGSDAPPTRSDESAPHEQAAALAVPAVSAGRYVLQNVQSAKCVDAVPPGSDGGAFVQNTCSAAVTQTFDLTVQAGGSYKLVAVGTGRVMDLAASSTADGAVIHQWTNNDTNAQRFVLQRSQGNRFALKNAGSGKCVAIDGGSVNDGAGLRQAGCSTSGAQQFLLYPVSTTGRGVLAIGRYALKAVHSGLCMDVENGSLDNGAKTAQAACSQADRQLFEAQPAAEGTYAFLNVNSGKGLDVSDISLDNGALIQQWAHGGGANQRFVVTDDAGALRIAARHSGRCVDVSGVSTQPGARIHQWGCLGAANQRWTPVPAGDTPPPPTGTWVGTWGASPQGGNTSFNQQTLRQIVHTSVGGAAARVHLSNVFGNQPITVANVHIAQRAGGSAIVAASDRAVNFGGQPTVVIPAGGEAVSDSVDFNVAALSDVAISFYLPNATTVTTEHQTGLQTNYVAAGNVSGNATISPSATSGSYRLLTNLDVSNSSLRGSVATLGASITDGVGTNFDANQRWPNVLANRLNAAGIGVGVLNQGISGNSSLRDGAGPSAENRFDRDVLGQAGIKWVIYSDDPINDLRGNPQPTLEQLLGPLQRMIAKAHARQVKFLCSTLTPYSDSVWTPSQETTRQAYNNFVKSSASGCDGVIDQDLATRDPANPARMLPANDTGDHLHPNTAGNAAIANSVNLNLFTP
jgi:lysophospholipase L1-like esterase